MEAVREFFAGRYGVEATGFTVVASTDLGAINIHSRKLTGQSSPHRYMPLAAAGWVAETLDGRAFMGLIYVDTNSGLNAAVRTIAHEYFHVLQGTLIKGSGYIPHSPGVPIWLVEGHAVYADYLYSQDEAFVRRQLLKVSDLKSERSGIDLGDLREVDSFWNDHHSSNKGYVYGVGLAAAQYLGDPAYLEFWKALGRGMGWREALRVVSGVGFDEFNQAFKEWLLPRIPQLVYVSVDVHWPRMGSPALRVEDYLSIGVDWVTARPSHTGPSNWSGRTRLTKALYSDTTGSGYVCLKWIAAEDNFPLKNIGWYADGNLVSSREYAELIELTGESITLEDWSLPGHPDTLQPQAEGNCH